MEANPEELKSAVVHEEASKEEAALETFRALMKQYGDQYLVVGCHRKLKKWNQGDGGSWKKLAATCRGMTRRAIPARCKGHGCQGQGKNNIVQGTRKVQIFGKKNVG
jgi:hypothetical protein